ncbi:unnamed protein product [Owenia fusiformis]|uniref:Annexin n=1 Tax=Owenia fusiformis TaxID=6347 RepID=A0A8J1UIS6_OWEFU|nr:unnamed protein product [Owenia fusiformis]
MPKTNQGGFPAGNKLLQKRWAEQAHRLHVQKMHSMKPGLDNSPPKRYPHLVLRLKKVQMEENRQAEIDHDNKLLLQKMTGIMKGGRGGVDNWNYDYHPRSLNQHYREREQEKIALENMKIAKMLDQVRPKYQTRDWEDDYQRHNYLLDLWGESAKDFGDSSSPRSTRSEGNSPRGGAKGEIKPAQTDRQEKMDEECKQLFKVCKKLSDPDDILIRCLIKKTPAYRKELAGRFKDQYDLDLHSELKAALGSPYAALLDALLGDKSAADAEAVHKALHGSGNKAVALVKLLVDKTPEELQAIKDSYKNEHGESLEEDIKYLADEECEALLLTLLNDGKNQDHDIDFDAAEEDAKELHEAGDGRWDKDSEVFLTLLSQKSLPQLNAILKAYKQISGKAATDVVDKECTEEFAEAFSALVKCVGVSPAQYAEQLKKHMKSGNPVLIEILMAHADTNLGAIRKAYKKKYGTELADDIYKHCGPSGKVLAVMAEKNPPGQAKAIKKSEEQAKKKMPPSGVKVTGPPKRDPVRKPQQKKEASAPQDSPLSKPSKKSNTDSTNKSNNKNSDNKDKDKQSKDKEEPKTSGTIKPASKFNVDSDVKDIHDAIQGWGTNEGPLIQILSGRSNEQRQEIKKKYQEKYEKDLQEELEGELTGDFEEVILGLLMPPIEYDAYCLHEAMDGAGTSEAVLIGVLSTRNAKQLSAIKEHYKKEFYSELSEDIEDDTSGDFKDILLELVKGERDQGTTVDNQLAKDDAKAIYDVDEEAVKVKEEKFTEIFSKQNRAQVRALIEEYKALAGDDIREGIKKSASGDAEDAYLGLVGAIEDVTVFYAERLLKASSGIGTNDKMLIRIIVSRSEIDLVQIKAKFKELSKKSLEEVIEDECSGDYKKMLLAIVKDK